MKIKYNNITISGGVSVGKNTLLNNLKPYLKDWKFFSGGLFMREYAIKHGLISKEDAKHHLATVYGDDFDRQVDAEMPKRLKEEKHLIIESWLAGFLARDLKKTLRILLICSNDALRVDRIVNRDKTTVEEAKHNIHNREEENFKKWQRLYGNHNFFDPKYYQLVIDTYSSGPLETVGKVLDKLGYDNNKIFISKK